MESTPNASGNIVARAGASKLSDGLTSRDRRDLADLVRRREKVAKTAAKQRAAELLADVEEQLAATFKAHDDRWVDVTKAAQESVKAADQEIARICRDHGVPEEFRPRLTLGWHGRGQNAEVERRTELRRVATTRIAAMELAARSEIERGSLDAQTALLAGGLTSDAAHAVLAALPTAEALMPGLSLDELEAALPIGTGARR